jgi:hypothetical protein
MSASCLGKRCAINFHLVLLKLGIILRLMCYRIYRAYPGKAYRGALNNTDGSTLLGEAIKAAVARAEVDPGSIEGVVMERRCSKA